MVCSSDVAGGSDVLTEPCAVCCSPGNKDECVLCDTCDKAMHIHCVGISSIPAGEWSCPWCLKRAAVVTRSCKVLTFFFSTSFISTAAATVSQQIFHGNTIVDFFVEIYCTFQTILQGRVIMADSKLEADLDIGKGISLVFTFAQTYFQKHV